MQEKKNHKCVSERTWIKPGRRKGQKLRILVRLLQEFLSPLLRFFTMHHVPLPALSGGSNGAAVDLAVSGMLLTRGPTALLWVLTNCSQGCLMVRKPPVAWRHEALWMPGSSDQTVNCLLDRHSFRPGCVFFKLNAKPGLQVVLPQWDSGHFSFPCCFFLKWLFFLTSI